MCDPASESGLNAFVSGFQCFFGRNSKFVLDTLRLKPVLAAADATMLLSKDIVSLLYKSYWR